MRSLIVALSPKPGWIVYDRNAPALEQALAAKSRRTRSAHKTDLRTKPRALRDQMHGRCTSVLYRLGMTITSLSGGIATRQRELAVA